MMATVPHVTSGSGLGKFQADGFLLDRVYHSTQRNIPEERRPHQYRGRNQKSHTKMIIFGFVSTAQNYTNE